MIGVAKDYESLYIKYRQAYFDLQGTYKGLRKDFQAAEKTVVYYKTKYNEEKARAASDAVSIQMYKLKSEGVQSALALEKSRHATTMNNMKKAEYKGNLLHQKIIQVEKQLKKCKAEMKKLQSHAPSMIALAMKETKPTTLNEDIRRLRSKVLPFGSFGTPQTAGANTLIWLLALLAIIGRIE